MMKGDDINVLCKVLDVLFNREKIQRMAREMGVVKREWMVDIFGLIKAIMIATTTGGLKSIEQIRRIYNLEQGQSICKSAFYDRLDENLEKLIIALFEEACLLFDNRMTDLIPLKKGIDRLLIMDATSIVLHNALKAVFPSCNFLLGKKGTMKEAVCKIHLALDPAVAAPQFIRLTPETTNDVTQFEAGPHLEGALVTIDRGYYSFC